MSCIPISQNMNFKPLTQFIKLRFLKGGLKEFKNVFLEVLAYF